MKKLKKIKTVVALVILLVTIVGITGCRSENSEVIPNKQEVKKAEKIDEEKVEEEVVEVKEIVVEEVEEVEEVEDPIRERMKQLTMEEKIGQLFIIDLATYHKTTRDIGGLIFFEQDLTDPGSLNKDIKAYQSKSKIPLFISIDEEGGLVSRLANHGGFTITAWPSAREMGIEMIKDATLPNRFGVVMGSELLAHGFNMNFAPVADVDTNPSNPVIGSRAYGRVAEDVATILPGIIKGMQSMGVIAVAKHFPGHGDTSSDSHLGQVILEHDIDRLRTVEWVPFEAAIEADVEAIMMGHILVPKLTAGSDIPASLSHDVILNYLRGELNFQGLVITDAMNMGAITDSYSTEEAVALGFVAGVDIFLMPTDFEAGFSQVLDMIKEQPEMALLLDEKVYRILSAKAKYRIL
jgi:beta-N-acetylhexosaminidase